MDGDTHANVSEQAEGAFRTDLPPAWLATTFYSLLHGAAEQTDVGQLGSAEAADMLIATLLPAFSVQSH